MSRRGWVVWTVVGLVVTAVGVTTAWMDLDSADKIGSVVGAMCSVLGLVTAAYALWQTQQSQPAPPATGAVDPVDNELAERAKSEPPDVIGFMPQLASYFRPRDTVRRNIDAATAAGHVVVLSGMGGVGKTQIAAWYAASRSQSSDVDLLLWVNAASQDGVLSAYAQAAIARSLATDKDRVSVAAARFLAWLNKTGCSWLVVLDDLSDPTDLVGLWPPDQPSGRVLVTTRRDEYVLRSGRCQLIKVGLFTMAESTGYVRARLDNDQERLIDAESLIGDLDGLPLALAQATAYMQNLRLTCTQYRQRFADRARSLVRVLPADPGDGHRHTVAVTWLLSIEAADELDTAGIAKPLLQLASELDPNGIPEAVFSSLSVRSWLSERRQGPTALEDPRDGLLCLERFNLIKFEGGVVRVHALVQRATREQFASERRGVLAVADAALQEVWDRSRAVDWRVISMLVKVIIEAGNGDRRREVFGQLLNMVDHKGASFADAWDATYVIRDHFHDLVDLVLDCLGGEQVVVELGGTRPASQVGLRPRVTQQAASTLAYCFEAIRDWREADPDRAIPLLAMGLTRWANRKRFPTALAMYEDRRALDVLLRYAGAEMAKTKPDPDPLTTTAIALGKLGAAFPAKRADCVGVLTEIMKVQDRDTQRAAINAKKKLTGGGDPESAIDEAEIIAGLAIDDGEQCSDWHKVITYVDHAAIHAKASGLSAELLGAISKALDHQNVVVPEAVARFLGQADDPRAAVVLRAKLQDPNLSLKVRAACTEALKSYMERNSNSRN